MSPARQVRCDQTEQVSLYAVHALPPDEARQVQTHLAECAECRRGLDMLAPVVDALGSWPIDVLRPEPSLWNRLEQRIAVQDGHAPATSEPESWSEPEWEDVAPGIQCKILATDEENDRVSLLVRLGPGVAYPPHTHAGFEELHLLDGELWINDRKLFPGDYNRSEPGTVDTRVWSETGCTCVLMTSPGDLLR